MQSWDCKCKAYQHLIPPPHADPPELQTPQQPAQSAQQVVHLNWSHFNQNFQENQKLISHTNDWMNGHHFIDVKIQRFCLRPLGEASLWYHSLEPINVNWQGLQNLFRQQYSKIGNTREQLCHAWRSFSFDENTGTVDAYITCIRQVATLLSYGEPQSLEVFKNTLPQNCIGYYSQLMTSDKQ